MNQSTFLMLMSFVLSVSFVGCSKKDVVSSYKREANQTTNSLSTVTFEAAAYEYDGNGKLIKVTGGYQEPETGKTYTYDAKGQLVKVSQDTRAGKTYTYGFSNN